MSRARIAVYRDSLAHGEARDHGETRPPPRRSPSVWFAPSSRDSAVAASARCTPSPWEASSSRTAPGSLPLATGPAHSVTDPDPCPPVPNPLASAPMKP